MSGKSKEALAAKRASKLAAIEAAKPPAERLLQKEWNDHVEEFVSVKQLYDIK
jgi:hypothetical protein